MRKNVIFVFAFAAVIVGLVQLHTYSQKEIADAANTVTVTDIKGIAEVSYPLDIEERNDIPFRKLIDPEVLKHIADSVDVEMYRPAKIFLAKGFNAEDTAQIKNFSNIVINANTIEGFSSANLNEEAANQIAQSVKMSIEQNALQAYTISDWEVKPIEEFNGNKILRYEYKQTNHAGKVTRLVLTYLFKDNKQIEVQMSATEKDYAKWLEINDKLVRNITIKNIQQPDVNN